MTSGEAKTPVAPSPTYDTSKIHSYVTNILTRAGVLGMHLTIEGFMIPIGAFFKSHLLKSGIVIPAAIVIINGFHF